MRTVRLATHLGILGLALLLTGSRAHATDPCVDDAKLTLSDCKADCKEGYQTAKDACLNRDHDCVERCREGREGCVLASGLYEALAACRHTLSDAKDACRTDHADDDTAIDQCIDQVQVVAFLCRKSARSAAKPTIKACRAGFRACASGCGPATVQVDALQCKLDAKDAYLACKATCRETFQSQKDLCLNRDHACVEQCRADRDACRAPIEDQLDADIADCRATLLPAVQNCMDVYPEGTDRDTCILNAQVAAFVCRDDAREQAAPGLQACRDQFQTCVVGDGGSIPGCALP